MTCLWWKNPCPANGNTKRQEIKELIYELNGRYPGLKARALAPCSGSRCRRGGRQSTADGPCLRNWRIFSKFDRKKFPARMETGEIRVI